MLTFIKKTLIMFPERRQAMKINETLKKAVTYNPTKQTFQMSAINLCEKIETNDITLPLYQRDVSWTIQKSIDLLNYQLNGKAPVSPISVNKITDYSKPYVTQVTFVNRVIIDLTKIGQLSVTDGQQRLTTNYKCYINHPDFSCVVLDLKRGHFIEIDNITDIKPHQIPVGILLNKSNDVFFNYINSSSTLRKPECTTVLLQARSKLRDYNYTINLAEDLSEEEQIDWFEVLNNAGSRVTRVQMRFSKLRLEGIDIYSQYTKIYKEKLDIASLDVFDVKNTEISIPIANLNCALELITGKEHSLNFAPIPSDVKENQLCNLSADELRKCFSLTLSALDSAISFIQNNNLKKPDRIDYISYLTGYFVFAQTDKLSAEQNQNLVDWYNTTDFVNKPNGKRRTMFNNLLNI